MHNFKYKHDIFFGLHDGLYINLFIKVKICAILRGFKVILGFNSQTRENASLCGNGGMRENAAICGKWLS